MHLMKNSALLLLLIGLFCGLALAEKPGIPDLQTGPLQQINEPLRDLARLGVEDGKLTIDREHWQRLFDEQQKGNQPDEKPGDGQGQPGRIVIAPGGGAIGGGRIQIGGIVGRTNTPFDLVTNSVRSRIGPSRISTGRTNHLHTVGFSNNDLSFSAGNGEGLFTLSVEEQTGPGRLLRIQQKADGNVFVQMVSADGSSVVILHQDSEGKASLTLLAGGKSHTDSAESFLKLYGQNRQLFDQQVWPRLEHNGVGLPIMPTSPDVVAAAIEILRGSQGEQFQANQALLSKLADRNFKTRQEASETLSKNYLACAPLIHQALADESIEAETKHRLETIVQANAEAHRLAAIVQSLGLLDQVDYLQAMAKAAKTETDRKMIQSRIEEISADSSPDK